MNRRDHAQKRRLLSHAFAYRSIVAFEPLLQGRLEKLVNQFDKMCKSGQHFDALLWFNYLAFDILSVLAFGEAIGMVENVTFIHTAMWATHELIILVMSRARTQFLSSGQMELWWRMNTPSRS
jgi:cytochrome P450